ncbi:MAG: hypothetical protein SPF56_02430 [Bacteroidaceae bacterium]|nr:hypothetical protein [Bacteroidaceae bacterium]
MKLMRNSAFAALLLCGAGAQAQNTYINDQLTANDQLNGTARFVGMGGAMGALGADLSTISANPAGIGLYRRSDLGMSFGVVMPNGNGWDSNSKTTYGENLNRASFDQFGAVFSLNSGGNKIRFVNFAFNYQKKLNFNQGFFADQNGLGGASQMSQLAQMATDIYGSARRGADGKLQDVPNNVTGLAMFPSAQDASGDNYYFAQEIDANGKISRYNDVYSDHSNYTRHQRGGLKSYDMNVSMNVSDRFFWGATLGIDRLDYEAWSEYGEFDKNDKLNHSLYNDTKIEGTGINGKLGFIVRPFAYNSFRVGLAVETPTWYRLSNSTHYNLNAGDKPESYLEYTLRTPWKVRLQAGQTIGSKFAWGAEYEFANYGKTKMGYPAWDVNDPDHNQFRTLDWDVAMNQLTSNTLRGQHTLRLGVEYKPVKSVALRAGYNAISSRYEDKVGFDQYEIDSRAMNYATNTEYMRLGGTSIVTLGMGYQHKGFYVDMTYQFRAQRGDFYAFDSANQTASLRPVDVNLNRHQIQLGLGYRF